MESRWLLFCGADCFEVQLCGNHLGVCGDDGLGQCVGIVPAWVDLQTDVNQVPIGIKTEGGKIIADGAAAMTHITMRRLTGTLIVALITLAMSLVTVVFIRSLCKAVESCASPFEDNVIRRMTALAYSLIPWCIISSLSNSVFTSVFSNKVNINLGIDLGMVFVVLVVLALAYIFKYGAMLQRESDETL